MTYTYELVWEENQVPTVYLCQNGVRIALIYEDPILVNPDNPDDINSWKPGHDTQELIDLLRFGREYRRGLNKFLHHFQTLYPPDPS